jgi:basic membrane protein A and related proteins
MKVNRLYVLVAFALVVLALVSCAPAAPAPAPTAAPAEPTAAPPEPTAAPAADKLKVALLLYGPLADTGWNGTAYEGLKDAEKAYGVQVAMSEDIQVPDIEAVMRDYAGQGYDLIIGHSFPFAEPAMKVAPDFPKTIFTVTNGYTQTTNVASFYPVEVQSHYVAGALAALMTKSGKVGIIGGVELPNMRANFNAFEMGVKATNPDVKVLSSYVGSWGDPAKGKETALAQLNDGVDIMFDEAAGSGLGILEAAQEKKVPVVSYVTLDSKLGGDQLIGTLLPNYRKMVSEQVRLATEGKLEGKIYSMDLASGMLDLFLNDRVPADIKAKVAEIRQQIIDGKIVVPENFD